MAKKHEEVVDDFGNKWKPNGNAQIVRRKAAGKRRKRKAKRRPK